MCEHWKGEAVKVLLCCLCLMCVQASPLLVYVKPIVHAVVFLCFVCVYCSIGLDQAHSTFCCVLVFCVCPLQYWSRSGPQYILLCSCVLCASSPLLVQIRPIVHSVVFLCLVCVHCSIGLDQAHSTFCCVPVFCVCPVHYWSRSGPQYILLCSCVLCVSTAVLVKIRPTVHAVVFPVFSSQLVLFFFFFFQYFIFPCGKFSLLACKLWRFSNSPQTLICIYRRPQAHRHLMLFVDRTSLNTCYQMMMMCVCVLVYAYVCIDRTNQKTEMSQRACYQLLMRVTQVLREEYIQKQEHAQKELETRLGLPLLLSSQNSNLLSEMYSERGHIRIVIYCQRCTRKGDISEESFTVGDVLGKGTSQNSHLLSEMYSERGFCCLLW